MFERLASGEGVGDFYGHYGKIQGLAEDCNDFMCVAGLKMRCGLLLAAIITQGRSL
jgi:hypothetical protein